MTYTVYYCVKCKVCYTSSLCTQCNRKDLKKLINEAIVITKRDDHNVCLRVEDFDQ
jgi:hypothetical protein